MASNAQMLEQSPCEGGRLLLGLAAHELRRDHEPRFNNLLNKSKKPPSKSITWGLVLAKADSGSAAGSSGCWNAPRPTDLTRQVQGAVSAHGGNLPPVRRNVKLGLRGLDQARVQDALGQVIQIECHPNLLKQRRISA